MEVKMMILKGLISYKKINQTPESFFKSSKLTFVIFLFALAVIFYPLFIIRFVIILITFFIKYIKNTIKK